ncbi:MAG: HD family phosphohydrolase [Planctomycetota bacterium]|jgi:putative nucleotidyltransferase with HDIG domain
MAVFGKRRRIKRVLPEKGRLPDFRFRLQAVPLPQKRLKIGMVFLLTLASFFVIHMNEFSRLFRQDTWLFPLSTALILILLNWAFWYYTFHFHRDVGASVKRFILVGALVLGTLLAGRVMANVIPANVPVNLVYLIPVAFTTLTLTIVFNQQFGMVATGYLAVGLALALHYTKLGFPGPKGLPVWSQPAPGIFPTLMVVVGGAMMAALSVGRIRDRSKLIKVGAGVGVVLAILILAAEAIHGNVYMNIEQGKVGLLLRDPVWGMVFGLSLGFLVSGALPFIEHYFEVATDISLIELSDHNHPLLRRLLLEAPGTYHHSFITGTLAEEAAEAIGANSLLARVGGYFHDIGKITKPEYFTENESLKGSHHARLSPTISTLIILAHTKDGIELAKDYNLPPVIIDFIPQHHGTSVIEYFYREALEQSGGRFEVRKEYFRYLGPKPQTRETAIVSIADSVEAASRSLSDPTPARIEGLVHNILTSKLMDNQLDACTLTFRELKIIEDTFVRVLAGIYHGRIAYPEQQVRKAAS